MKVELSKGCDQVSNPLLWSCWTDEDYIGRNARLSRRVGAHRLLVVRTMTRSLMQYKRHFERS